MMPFEPEFGVVEISRALPLEEGAVKGRKTLISSDAHQLGAIMEADFDLACDRFSVNGLFESLLSRNN
jgi:hypothetical protein